MMGAAHLVRVDSMDGKRSLIKLPDSMFRHFELILEAQRVESAPVPPLADAAVADKATVTDRAFDLVAGLLRDRLPAAKTPSAETVLAPQVDVTDQLHKLAALRDAGVLTEQEFASKKAELLARL